MNGRRSEGLLYLTVAIFGFVAMMGQALLIREALVVFYGNELSVGVVLGSWFVGIFAGALISRRFAWEDQRRFERLFVGLLLFSFLVSLQVLNMRVVRWYMGVGVGELVPLGKLLLACMLAVAPVGMGVGLVFPLATVAGVRFKRDAVARVYVLEALGSVGGGLAFTFLIVKYLNPLLSLAICAGALMILAGFLGAGEGKRFLCLGFICAGALIAVVLPLDSVSIRVRWETLAGRARLVQMKESVYQNIALGEAEEQYMIYGNGHVLDIFSDEYNQVPLAHVILAQHPEPSCILLVGGGLGGLIKGMLEERVVENIDYVEFDEKVLEVAGKYMRDDWLEDKRVRVFAGDILSWQKPPRKYDIVFINVGDPASLMLNRYFTAEVYRKLKGWLREGGVVVTSLMYTPNYIGAEVADYAGSVYKTLRSVFKYVVVYPGGRLYMFASDGEGVLTEDGAIMMARYRARGVESKYFTAENFPLLWIRERVEYTKRLLESSQAPINRASKPIATYFNVLVWMRLMGKKGVVFAWLRRFWMWLVGIFSIWVLAYLIGRGRRGWERVFYINVIAGTAFTAMLSEMMLIYGFQVSLGYIYSAIGALVASFMLGLVGGGALARKFPTKWGLIVCEIALAGYVGAVGLAMGRAGDIGAGVFYGALFVGGVLTGYEFPTAVSLLSKGGRVGQSVAVVEAFDHLGASLGALAAGVIIIPVFGFLPAAGIVLFIKGLTLMGAGLAGVYRP